MLSNQELLHLSLIDGIGPAAIGHIAQAIERDLVPSLYQANQADFVRLGFSAAVAQMVVSGVRDSSLLEKELARIERHQIHWTTITQETYPALLKHIHLPPPVLYWKGQLPAQETGILAFVGSRAANWYGKQVIDRLVPPLVAHGMVIVSGGALGADSMAHAATLAAGGITVAVLGAGLLEPYPVRNKPLFDQIVACGGAVVSPFPLMMHANTGTFPARNRVIAGMSTGSVVVQAAAKSGALITARFSLEQGREVFAVPGPIEDPLSAGCHALIKQGAHMVTCAEDILQECCSSLAPMHAATLSAVSYVQQSCIEPEHSEPTPTDVLMRLCAVPTAFDELVARTGLSCSQANELLFELQIQGVLEQNAVGMWQRIR